LSGPAGAFKRPSHFYNTFSFYCGAVWACKALNSQTRRFPARTDAEYSLVNITLRNLLLEDNDGHGFQFWLTNWARKPANVLAPISLSLESVVARGSLTSNSISAGLV
jgi:hypothetical protein